MNQPAPCCQLLEQPRSSIIELRGEVNILQAGLLKELLLQSLDRKKSIRVDMSGIVDLDIAAIQLLCSVKKMAAEIGLAFKVSPQSKDAQSLISYAGVSFEAK